MGNLLVEIGEASKAEYFYRRAIEINNTDIRYYHALLMSLLYNYGNDPKSIFNEHLNFSDKFEIPLSGSFQQYKNRRIPDKKLRIGYVSADFKQHSVAYFIEPIISAHNREEFEIFCYSGVAFNDEVTERIQRISDHWDTITGKNEKEIEELIRGDEIDILMIYPVIHYITKYCSLQGTPRRFR